MTHTITTLAAGLVALSGVASMDVHAQSAAPAQRRPMTFDDFSAVRVVGGAQISPDGQSVLYSVRTTNVSANTRTSATFRIPVAGGTPQQFPSASVNAGEAVWSPDGKHVAYTAGGQLWVVDAAGQNARQLTNLARGASGPVWSPTGDRIAFVSNVYPECTTDECTRTRDKAREDSKVKAIVTDQLMFRHWNQYWDGTRSHLFVIKIDGTDLRDLTPGAPYDVPPGPFGGSEGYAFAPDGQEVAYTAKDQGREEAWTTDLNVYTVPVTGGTPAIITQANKGVDANPVYSPDGKGIIYSSMERAGFEADQLRLMWYDRATRTHTRLMAAWPLSADGYQFSADGNTIYIQTVDASAVRYYALAKSGNTWNAMPARVISGMNNSSLSIANDGRTAVWIQDAMHLPGEVYTGELSAQGTSNVRKLTSENDALVAQLQLFPGEEFWYTGALGDSVQGFVIKPAQYEAGKKYPVLLIIHGGPQSAFLDQWHQRWNFSLFASRGMGVVWVNPHGSPGYGQKFVDQVTGDWGGAAYEDIMQGLDAALQKHADWMDASRVGAAGASYGGYMVNWIAGHTDRFKALFTHAGVFNLEHMYGATEELWFSEWETHGPYWNKEAMETQYRRWSPHLFAGQFRTPHLVVHGELDYRVPVTEGLSLFSALQRQNVPSRLILFPDEGHWIAKAQNQQLWYSEIFAWFEKYLQ